MNKIIKAGLKSTFKSYRENAQKVSFAFCDRPLTPMQTTVWWMEHVISTGGMGLARTKSVNVSWFTFHSVDVIATLLPVSLAIAVLLYRFLRFCCGQLRVSKKSQTERKEENCANLMILFIIWLNLKRKLYKNNC